MRKQEGTFLHCEVSPQVNYLKNAFTVSCGQLIIKTLGISGRYLVPGGNLFECTSLIRENEEDWVCILVVFFFPPTSYFPLKSKDKVWSTYPCLKPLELSTFWNSSLRGDSIAPPPGSGPVPDKLNALFLYQMG